MAIIAGLSWYYLTPEKVTEKVTIYVTYPYNTNGSFQISMDSEILVYEDNYSFDYLPPYLCVYEGYMHKGEHTLFVFDGTFNRSLDQKIDVESELYIIVEINENGIRIITTKERPSFI